MSFGEAVLAFPVARADTAQIFKSLYQGFTEEASVRFAYGEDDDVYELPIDFSFSAVCRDSHNLFKIMINPAILPVDFH